jgi:hypothetical protein
MADPTLMQLLTYTVMKDDNYDNGKLMNVKGLEDAVPATGSQTANVGTVNNPIQSGITIDSSKRDPVVFSFEYINNGTKELRMLLATIVTPTPGQASTDCLYSLLKMGTNGDWTALATNVQLCYPTLSVNCANNPHGVAQIGNMLYIIDYDTQMIYFLDGDALTGATAGKLVLAAPFSLVSTLNDPKARAQALIALNNSLFALYISCEADAETHYDGTLVRVTVSGQTTLSVSAQTKVGMNPQMIIPIHPTSGSPILLIPAIGGKQKNQGAGNYTVSNITKVPAVGTWPSPAPKILVSNAPNTVPTPPVGAPPAISYTLDIQAIAAPVPAPEEEELGDDGIVYILSGIYNGDEWTPKSYALWKTTVGDLNSLVPENNTSVWTAYDDGILSGAENGNVPGYFWDIFYENKGGGLVGRLWFLRGSPIIVSPASDYNAGGLVFNRGTNPGQIGGENVNSVDLTAEIARQVQAGVSLRRGLRAHKPSIRAAKAAPTVAVAAEEEEE